MPCVLKVMLDDIVRHGPEIANQAEQVGRKIRERAEQNLASLYPPDPDGSIPIAYLWARTVQCEAPGCGAELPLMRSFWLCRKPATKTKPARKIALRPSVDRTTDSPQVVFEIFEPTDDGQVHEPTVSDARATCLACSTTLPPARVRAQLSTVRGGADPEFDKRGQRIGGARLTAVVTLKPGLPGRRYRAPRASDYASVRCAQSRRAQLVDDWASEDKQGVPPYPDEKISPNELRRISVPIYGMERWGDLFSARQTVALAELASAISELDSRTTLRSATKRLLAIALDKTSDLTNALARWKPDAECQ